MCFDDDQCHEMNVVGPQYVLTSTVQKKKFEEEREIQFIIIQMESVVQSCNG